MQTDRMNIQIKVIQGKQNAEKKGDVTAETTLSD